MSKYKLIQTEYKNLSSLLKALADIGFTKDKIKVATDPKVPSLHLIGYQNDRRPELASIVLPKMWVGSASNDVGFAWTGTSFSAIVSDYDSGSNFGDRVQNRLKQSYAKHELTRMARAKGYNVQEQQNSDGSIRLVCVHR